ncbi:MAG: sigma-54-dependent Fis family transcriptional regulator [bacterium]
MKPPNATNSVTRINPESGFPEIRIPASATPFDENADEIALDQLRRSYLRLGRLYEVSQSLLEPRDAEGVFNAIARAVTDLVGAERVLIATLEGEHMTCRASCGFDAAVTDVLPVSKTIVGTVLATAESVLSADAQHEAQYRDAASVVVQGIRSVMCCALRPPRDRPVGFVYADSNLTDRAFDHEDLRFLHALAHYGSLALESVERLATERALARDRSETLCEAYGPDHEFVGTSAKSLAVMNLVRRAAASNAPVLVVGETGTGKEIVARALHWHSPRRDGPFIPVNMGTMLRDTALSELFGHERGAFTGAHAPRSGLFRQASGGVLFLDEITAATPDVQVMLLRTLQEATVRPLGGRTEVKVDVRLVAACNVDIEEEVRAGRFREDLFYRLNVVRLDLPPLRERPEDLELLLNHFLTRFAPHQRYDPAALRLLCTYSWPGNVRELRNTVESLTILTPGDVIGIEDIPDRVRRAARPAQPTPASGPLEPLRVAVQRLERDHIQKALRETAGNRDQAAELLGVGRATLYEKIKQYGIASSQTSDRSAS